MGFHYERARLLFNQGRYEMAERELREDLAEYPYHGQAHAFLGRCLAQQKRLTEALEEGAEGVRLAPHLAYAHYMLGITYDEAGRLDEAEAALREALRLEPRNVSQLHWLSWIQYRRGERRAALDTADLGLAIDPQHVVCLNSRGQYLRALGRKNESEAPLRTALALDPTYAFTHANLAWTLWVKGSGWTIGAPALRHFREALRLNPGMDWARTGATTIYFTRARTIVLTFLGALFVVTIWVLGSATDGQGPVSSGRRHDQWIMGLLLIFFGSFMILFSKGSLYALVRLSRFGRALLSPAQRGAGAAAAVCLALAGGAGAASLVTAPPTAFAVFFLSLALIAPLTAAYEASAGPARTCATAYLALLAVAGAAGLACVAGNQAGWQDGAVVLFLCVLTPASCASRGIARRAEKLFAKKAA